jgi:spore coat polysaccharide biosynthesis predicted glycosyltransferase SpsG/RimJ/RimL family protein N-acetyltransferase
VGRLALLRCDADDRSGVGHLVRCVAVAEAAQAAGWCCRLVGRVTAPLARQLVAAAGMEVLDDVGTPLDELARSTGATVLHVDHYDTPSPAPGSPTDGAPVVSAVQDGRHGRRDAHVVLDATPGGAVAAAVVEAARVRLTGPSEAVVRREVRALAGRREGTTAPRVLVVAGGTDAAGIVPALTDLVVEAVQGPGEPLPYEVLVLDPAAESRPPAPAGVHRRLPGPDLAALAAGSTLVVTAAGTTTAELAVIGVPMAVVQAVGNQGETYSRLVRAGAALPLGSAADLVPHRARLADDLREVLRDPARRAALVAAAAGTVDGGGADRLVAAWGVVLAGSEVPTQQGWWVRPARSADSDRLLAWRNDPVTRTSSLSTDPVSPATHAAWFARVRADPDRYLLVVGHGGQAVGTVRLDGLGAGRWEVSLTVAPESRGRSIAGTVLACGEEYLVARGEVPAEVWARVREGNAPSRALFDWAGYTPLGEPVGDEAPGVLLLAKRLG